MIEPFVVACYLGVGCFTLSRDRPPPFETLAPCLEDALRLKRLALPTIEARFGPADSVIHGCRPAARPVREKRA